MFDSLVKDLAALYGIDSSTREKDFCILICFLLMVCTETGDAAKFLLKKLKQQSNKRDMIRLFFIFAKIRKKSEMGYCKGFERLCNMLYLQQKINADLR